MQAELPALFNHAFKAYLRLVASGYQWAGADKFKPEILITNTSVSFEKETVLKRFLDERCEFVAGAVTSSADLQSAYCDFCREHTYLPIIGDRFARELAAVLPTAVTRTKIGNQKRGFSGIRLKPVLKPHPPSSSSRR